jgi:2-oxoisovalerate dehydrogenase E1 component
VPLRWAGAPTLVRIQFDTDIREMVPSGVENEGGSVPDFRMSPAGWRELHLFARLAREWDLRFEGLLRQGAIGKWYSAVGNEALTVTVATVLEPGDGLLTLHRDVGAILRTYLDPRQLFPDRFREVVRPPPSADSQELLYRLACQMLGKAEGFTGGYDRSYHYSLLREDLGIVHVGMISMLGAMIPVAAGVALAFQQRGSDRVAVNFIGEGGTSTGDFHEALNMAAVLRVPLVLIIENNRYAFSTPAAEQYASDSLALRGTSYGIPGVQVDGTEPLAVGAAVSEAVVRARCGKGPTLIEAMLGRMRGHSEGDDSLSFVPEAERRAYELDDPLAKLERRLIAEGVAREEELLELKSDCHDLVLTTVDRALAASDPSLGAERPLYKHV